MTVVLDASQIVYGDDAEARKHLAANQAVCAAITHGSPFAVVFFDCTFHEEDLKMSTFEGLHYTMVVTKGGNIMPWPVFEMAMQRYFGAEYFPVPFTSVREQFEEEVPASLMCNYAPDSFQVRELEGWLRNIFGSQYRGHVDGNSRAKRQGYTNASQLASGHGVYFLSTFGISVRVSTLNSAQLEVWLYRGDSMSDEDFAMFIMENPHCVTHVVGATARQLLDEFEIGMYDRMAEWPTVERYLNQLEAIKHIMRYARKDLRDIRDLERLLTLLSYLA